MAGLKRRLPFVIVAVLPGLLGLGIGGYFVLRNVFGVGVSRGPNAC